MKVAGDIDYEQERTIEVTLSAKDKLGLELTKNITLTVENMKHGPILDVKLQPQFQCPMESGNDEFCVQYLTTVLHATCIGHMSHIIM